MTNEKWHSEEQMQAAFFMWVDEEMWQIRGTIFAVPNGAFVSKREAVKLVATGLKAGVSDIIWVLPYDVQFIELKLPGGVQSDKQKAFETRIKKMGHEYMIFYSLWTLKEFVRTKTKEIYGSKPLGDSIEQR